MKFHEVISLLKEDGWIEKVPRKKGSHRQYIHPLKPGKVTVPEHKGKDIKPAVLRNIENMTGVKLLTN